MNLETTPNSSCGNVIPEIYTPQRVKCGDFNSCELIYHTPLQSHKKKQRYVEEREERRLSESNKKPLQERNVGAKRVGIIR